MNYYKRHLGDFARDTSQLSQGQAGAYDLLLDWYYANEKPLPLDTGDLYRIARAFTNDERKNVAKAMGFFRKEADGYHQKRADEELARMKKQRDENRRIAAERETNRSTNRRRIVERFVDKSFNGSSNDSFNESLTDRSTYPQGKERATAKAPIQGKASKSNSTEEAA